VKQPPTSATPAPLTTRENGVRQASARVVIIARALRVSQWSKNGLVALAALFSRQLTHPETLLRVVVAFFAFCFVSSAVYIFNDLRDRESDRQHPTKRNRPIAAGLLSPRGAMILGGLALGVGLALTAPLASGALYPAVGFHDPFAAYGGAPLLFGVSVAAYLGLNAAYTLRLKQAALWDVFTIAGGFTLRALAGAFAAGVIISPWFYLTAIFLSLALATGKRRAELVRASAVSDDDWAASGTRQVLRDYTLPFLDQLMAVSVTCALITYSLYTFQAGTVSGDGLLMLTTPCVIFGVFRYLYLVYVRARGEEPDRLLLTDPQILGAVALYLLIIAIALYGPWISAVLHIHLP
jgi:4-hydroxybenzoate polyprenyltransferase